MKKLLSYFGDETGATAIEYAMIASLASIAILGGLAVLSEDVRDLFTRIAKSLIG